MTSIMYKKCFLCNVNVKEIQGTYLVDSHECSLILCQILNVSYLRNNLQKFNNIKYCHPCKRRILKIQESIEIQKKLEKEILDETYLIKTRLEENYAKNHESDLYYSQAECGTELVNEMKFKSIKSKLVKVVHNEICRQIFSKTKNFRIMKNITLFKRLDHGALEEHISKFVISKKLTTPLSYNLISTEKQPFLNSFGDTATNSTVIHVELPFTSNAFDFRDIKFETLCEESNSQTIIRDPFEGIVPESDFVAKNSVTQSTFICRTRETNLENYNHLDTHCSTNNTLIFSSESLGGETNSQIDIKDPFEGIYESNLITENFKTPKTLVCETCEHTVKKKVLKCKYCEKTFGRNYQVRRHEMCIHTKEKSFKCSYCEKAYWCNYDLRKHETIHTGNNSFKCSYCEKAFPHRYLLTRHERVHTGEKPFQCSYCEKKFNLNRELRRHELVHTVMKPFKCPYCENTFNSSYELKRHECVHTVVKPFK